MTLSEYILLTTTDDNYCHRPRIECADGFSMSVQGNSAAYCDPRQTTTTYDSMEIGFPSAKENIIMEYAEDQSRPTETVYGYVPFVIIEAVIAKHGGIINEVQS